MKNNFFPKQNIYWEERYCIIIFANLFISGLIRNSLDFISTFAFHLVHCHTSCIPGKLHCTLIRVKKNANSIWVLSWTYFDPKHSLKVSLYLQRIWTTILKLFVCLVLGGCGGKKHKSCHHWVKQNIPCV